MRDLVAGILALLLLGVAASLGTTLQTYRRRRQRARDGERALGRTIVAEIPAGDDLLLFTEDAKRFYYGDRSVDKDLIRAVRLLINGVPIAASPPSRAGGADAKQSAIGDDRADGIVRDRWDVDIEAVNGSLLVECGAIRERVSQELARAVFDAVKNEFERREIESR
jgi:hypothetical protein